MGTRSNGGYRFADVEEWQKRDREREQFPRIPVSISRPYRHTKKRINRNRRNREKKTYKS